MASGKERKVSPLGERILQAIEAEGRTQSSAEAMMIVEGILKHAGDLSSIVTGRRGTASINLDRIGAIADFLHVDFEWLTRGAGTMRRRGRGEATPAEEAFKVARELRVREDAITEAWERNRDRADEMSALDWMAQIMAEGERLDRAGIPKPNPEAAVKLRAAIGREKKRLERAGKQSAKAETAPAATLAKGKTA